MLTEAAKQYTQAPSDKRVPDDWRELEFPSGRGTGYMVPVFRVSWKPGRARFTMAAIRRLASTKKPKRRR